MFSERQMNMTTFDHRADKNYSAESIVIYLFLLLAVTTSAWLPYFFVQWTFYKAGFPAP